MVLKAHPHCLLCNDYLSHDLSLKQLLSFRPLQFDNLCQSCRAKFLRFEVSTLHCMGCKRTLEEDSVSPYKQVYRYTLNDQQTIQLCHDCFKWTKIYPLEYLNHQAVYQYNNTLREWLYSYKYQGDYRLREVVVNDLKQVYQQFRNYQWLVLPSSPAMMAERGFHATASLLEAADIPCQMPFRYAGDGIRQASKSRQERLLQRQPYEMKPDFIESVDRDSSWLIFDDVYTTGSTLLLAKQKLFEAANCLNLSNPQIISISLARDNLN